MQGELIILLFLAIIGMMKSILLALALTIVFGFAQTAVHAEENDSMAIEMSAAQDSAASANMTQQESVRIPQSWTMMLWAFVVGVLIISFAAKGRDKPPSDES